NISLGCLGSIRKWRYRAAAQGRWPWLISGLKASAAVRCVWPEPFYGKGGIGAAHGPLHRENSRLTPTFWKGNAHVTQLFKPQIRLRAGAGRIDGRMLRRRRGIHGECTGGRAAIGVGSA